MIESNQMITTSSIKVANSLEMFKAFQETKFSLSSVGQRPTAQVAAILP
jgi:hypothetical protein